MSDDLAERARQFATLAHQRIDHRRKYSNQPYDVHLKGVAQLVASVSEDPAVIAAAWMHDLVEDTAVTLDEIRRGFGQPVAELVAELTDVSRPADGNRAARKAIDRQHLAAASPAAKTVKLADLIDNCRDICRHDPRFAPTYLNEMGELLGVLADGDARLYRRAWSLWSREAARLGVGLADPATLPANDPAESVQAPRLVTHPYRVRRFMAAFEAEDLAEPVFGFDISAKSATIRGTLDSRPGSVAVLRRGGRVVGYATRDDVADDDQPARIQAIRADQRVPNDAPLPDVIEVLTRHDLCFVDVFGEVCGVACRRDMQKAPVRMWLFGILCFIETALSDRIRQKFPEAAWHRLLSASRLEKSQALQAERARLGHAAALLDCLQFGDKVTILLNDPEFPALFGFASRSAARDRMNDLQSLRNDLAHNQDIVHSHWVQIARLAREVARLSAEPARP
jgi:hypothetical protein